MSSFDASAGMPLRRPLAVQLAALNNDEMKSYTQILGEIAALEDGDRLQGNTGTIISTDYEQLVVNSRDVRAWIRGRYPSISLANIDAVRTT